MFFVLFLKTPFLSSHLVLTSKKKTVFKILGQKSVLPAQFLLPYLNLLHYFDSIEQKSCAFTLETSQEGLVQWIWVWYMFTTE